jgi:hypothetical protein
MPQGAAVEEGIVPGGVVFIQDKGMEGSAEMRRRGQGKHH